MIKSYRGLITDQEIHTIPLHTNDGKTGYKIIKFQLFPAGATSAYSYESFVSIFNIEPTSAPADATPDFSNNSLVACAYFTQSGSGAVYPEDLNVIFDNEVFNQDIFISHSNSESSAAINYYIELEQYPITENQALVAIIKDLREEQG